jgi:hypothetical protein
MSDAPPFGKDRTQTWPASLLPDAALPVLPSRWSLVRLLGSGGQADVWLAEDHELGEWVALKVFKGDLSETARERLRREVRLGRSLQHPSLVRLFELIEHNGRLAVAMEWLSGGSLAQRLRGGRLPVEDVVRCAESVLAALQYLHAHGIVHRDVKPSNLLVDAEGRVHLADLGLARPLDSGHDLTKTATTVGTPTFMSPEQIRGLKVTAATDLYSLGVTLFMLLTGGAPFAGRSDFELASQHLTMRVQDPRRFRRDCPRWLARFVMRLLEKRPQDRWADASAARQALQRRSGMTSPRVWRALLSGGAAAGVLAVFFLLAGVVGLHLRHGHVTVTVEASGNTVRGLDGRGNEVWHHKAAEPIRQVERADLLHDGSTDTIIVAWETVYQRGGDARPSEVAIIGPRGRVITRVHPEELVGEWPFEYPKLLNPIVNVLDLGHAHVTVVFVNGRDAFYYPTVLLVYWPRTGVWEPVLYHQGWIDSVVAVPDSNPPQVGFAGTNNRLAGFRVVGELTFLAPNPTAPRVGMAGGVPPFESGRPRRAVSLTSYTLLDVEGLDPGNLTVAPDGRTTLRTRLGVMRTDRFGNPDPGPNVGKDLRSLRTSAYDQLLNLGPGQQAVSESGVRALYVRLKHELAPLLVERPYHVVLAVNEARSLARVGALQRGIDLLQANRAEAPSSEVTLRLPHLEALAGNIGDAERLARSLLADPVAPRRFDALQLLLRLCIEEHDPKGFAEAVVDASSWEQDSSSANGMTAAVWARTHLWWDEVQDSDTQTISFALVPEGAAQACLARWRLGKVAEGDPEAMARGAQVNPDAVSEFDLAHAAALLGLGKARQAATELGGLIARLEPVARDDFANRQVLDLAKSVHVKALLAAGDRRLAFAEARSLRPTLRPGLLPRILVDEVIRASYSQPSKASDRRDSLRRSTSRP